MSLGKNAEIQEWIHDLKKNNAKLERMHVKLGTRADAETHSKLTKEREDTTKLIKKIIGALRDGKGNKEILQKLAKELEPELNKFEDICKRIENREREIMTAMGSDATSVEEDRNLSQEEKIQRLQEKKYRCSIFRIQRTRYRSSSSRNFSNRERCSRNIRNV